MPSTSTKTRRGRPPGRTPQGLDRRAELYDVAVGELVDKGYEGATMRSMARAAGVSPGLFYKYFDSKAAIVMELYQELTAQFVQTTLPEGSWVDRVAHGIEQSLATLAPRRAALAGLLPTLLGRGESGLFSPKTRASREAVLSVFQAAVTDGDEVYGGMEAPLGRLAYLAHLAIILFWLLDRSSGQRATHALVGSIANARLLMRIALRLPAVRSAVVGIDAVLWEGLTGEAP